MERKTTITISEEVKERLEKVKGNKSWDEFLLLLLEDYNRKKVEEGVKKLRSILTEEDLKKIEESHRKMHEELKL